MQSRLAYINKAQDKDQLYAKSISKNVKLTCLFGAFVFLQFTVLGLANHAGEGYLSTVHRDLVYYALQVFVILGYLLHSLFVRFCTGECIRRMAAYIVFCLFFLCVTFMLVTDTDSILSVIVSMAAVLCLGEIGGMVHYQMSLGTCTGADVARCMGIGSAAAVVMQFLLQIQWGVTSFLPGFMLAAFLLITIIKGKDSQTVIQTYRKLEDTPPRRIVFAILITVTFILFTCFFNEMIHHLMIQSNYASYNVYSWPRLMLVPGYLLFAVIGDRKDGKYVPIASVCIMLFALLNVVLAGNHGSYWFNMCLFYFSVAAFSSYYLLTFWRLAPGTKHPALWAPIGRILDSCMVLLTGIIHLSSLPVPVVLGCDIVGVVMVILMMAMEGDFNLTQEGGGHSSAVSPVTQKSVSEANPDSSAQDKDLPGGRPKTSGTAFEPLSPEEALAHMREEYQLTQREADVLRELVLTEDTQAAISDRLSIRVKTLQGYVTRIYRKTGSSTRVGLADLYHENRNGR